MGSANDPAAFTEETNTKRWIVVRISLKGGGACGPAALREGCGGRPEGAVSPKARRSASEPRSSPTPSEARGHAPKNEQ
jgi:hypothetical protein